MHSLHLLIIHFTTVFISLLFNELFCCYCLLLLLLLCYSMSYFVFVVQQSFCQLHIHINIINIVHCKQILVCIFNYCYVGGTVRSALSELIPSGKTLYHILALVYIFMLHCFHLANLTPADSISTCIKIYVLKAD